MFINVAFPTTQEASNTLPAIKMGVVKQAFVIYELQYKLSVEGKHVAQ